MELSDWFQISMTYQSLSRSLWDFQSYAGQIFIYDEVNWGLFC